MKISVAIVEDDKNYNQTLKRLLDYNDDLCCVGQYYSGRMALEKLPSIRPEIVLMDLKLQDYFGHQIITRLKPDLPQTNFIIITNFEEDDMIFNSLKAGAVGYLIKGESLEKITSSILQTYNGGSPMSNSIARKVLHHFENQYQKMNIGNALPIPNKIY